MSIIIIIIIIIAVIIPIIIIIYFLFVLPDSTLDSPLEQFWWSLAVHPISPTKAFTIVKLSVKN